MKRFKIKRTEGIRIQRPEGNVCYRLVRNSTAIVDFIKKLPSGTLLALHLIMKVTPSFSPGAIQRYGINRGRRRVPAVPRHFPRAICNVLARLRKEEIKTNYSITDKSRTTN